MPRRPKPPRPPAPPRDLAALTWVTGRAVNRTGLAAFTSLIRAPDDPDRVDIRTLPEAQRDRLALWRRGLARQHPAAFRRPILDLLAAGPPRTFNAVGVLLVDKTADMLFRLPPETALWELVHAELVEHTLDAPILFRPTAAGLGELARAAPGFLDDQANAPEPDEEEDGGEGAPDEEDVDPGGDTAP
jgi:hypothetical protein